jgi:hypothetical protein
VGLGVGATVGAAVGYGVGTGTHAYVTLPRLRYAAQTSELPVEFAISNPENVDAEFMKTPMLHTAWPLQNVAVTKLRSSTGYVLG